MIVFLHGPDTWRAKKKLQEIVVSYEKAHRNQVRSFYFHCKEAQVQDVSTALETISLFERKKLVVLENVFQNSSFVAWLEHQKEQLHTSEHHVVVVFESAEIKAKTQNKLYQWLRKHAKQQEFLLLSASNLKLWIAKEFGAYGLEVAPRAQELLARAVGGDLWRLSAEIKKIAAYKFSEQSKQVKETDITLFVQADAQADVFATIDAAASKNKKQAASLLYRHIQKGEVPQYLFSMLQYQFRTLLEVRDCLDRGLSRQDMASALKLHPYVLQKAGRLAERFSLAELESIYRNLFQADWRIKTGRADAEAALDLFVATL